MSVISRPNCLEPTACKAKGSGHCRRCHGTAYFTSVAGGAASKAALADPEVRARMSAASKAARADPEVRARMSAASKAAWADPEVRARMSAASKAARADPEVRARMSASQRRAAAKRAVQMAHLPMFRKTVDRARELLDQGEVLEVVADALIQEARAAASSRGASLQTQAEAWR